MATRLLHIGAQCKPSPATDQVPGAIAKSHRRCIRASAEDDLGRHHFRYEGNEPGRHSITMLMEIVLELIRG